MYICIELKRNNITSFCSLIILIQVDKYRHRNDNRPDPLVDKRSYEHCNWKRDVTKTTIGPCQLRMRPKYMDSIKSVCIQYS